ncbi:MAG: peptidase S8 [Ardenticatenia bacterium]|nr:MAG: peptidase S8 [Ardenticatenia bacterium]
MRYGRVWRGVLAGIVALLAFLIGQSEHQTPLVQAGTPGVIPNSFIVILNAREDAERVADEMQRVHALHVGHVYRHAVRGFAVTMSPERAEALKRDPRVKAVLPNQTFVLEGKPCRLNCGGGGSSTDSGPQTVPPGIARIGATVSSVVAGDGTGMVDVDVAVIDSGIDVDHPDLNVVGGYNCLGGPKRQFDDGYGHGTHVAGIIGARDNGFGVVGVAPGARLWAIKVFNDLGYGTSDSLLCGVDWVAAHAGRIDVANMSMSGIGEEGTCTDAGLHEAICNAVAAGVTFVVAAGNFAADAGNYIPARYDEVITVSAIADYDGKPGGLGTSADCTTPDDGWAAFSDYGADVDLTAPGVCVYSTYKDGGYALMSGTSMAAPHVAGAAALYRATHPYASPADVQAALVASGTYDWTGDPDGMQEPLVNVSGY